ncbi:MAG TPA: sulfatase-like hydrolase/transferase [Verrucomicrobiae bacterium]|jgi:arylsulfatase A-like enzyme
MKSNRLLIALAALLQFSAAARADLAAIFTNATLTTHRAVPRRPSIIFIECHGLAFGDLSCYGQTNFQTPNLDRLAAEGVRFTHYSGGAESPATTAMLLAGKNSPANHDELNLAQQLRKNGYHTGLIGEWTFDRQPWLHGFDDFAGFFTDAEAQDFYAERIWRYPHVTYDENNHERSRFLDHEMLYYNTGGKKGTYLPDLLVTAMLNFVKNNVPDAANHYRPFFLLANFPAPRTVKAGADEFPVPSDAPFTGEAWPQAAKNRAALITRLDAGIGRLFEQLDKSGMTNNVAIFFSSSSAPEKFADTNLNFLLPKNNFPDTNNPAPPPLPMIVHWPKTIPAGQVSGLRWTAADFAPTALEIGYVNLATNFTGMSILPLLHGRPGTNTPALPDLPDRNLPQGQ